MAGKQIVETAPTTIEELKARVAEKYRGVTFEHPYGYGLMEVARLKRHERTTIREATFIYGADGSVVRINDELQNRMAAAYGLVNPKVAETPERAIEVLKEYPDDFVEGIAVKVWDISNDYRNEPTNGKGEPEAAPFFPKMSGSSTGSSTEPTSPPTSSKDGTTSD